MHKMNPESITPAEEVAEAALAYRHAEALSERDPEGRLMAQRELDWALDRWGDASLGDSQSGPSFTLIHKVISAALAYRKAEGMPGDDSDPLAVRRAEVILDRALAVWLLTSFPDRTDDARLAAARAAAMATHLEGYEKRHG